MKRFLFPLILVVLVGGMIAIFAAGNGSSKQPVNSNTHASADGLPGILTNNGPWDANTGQLADRLTALGLPQLSAEGSVLHIHQHLDLYIHGKKTEVPSHIGIPASGAFISVLHTHATDGIMHVESPEQKDFTLGQFFDVWGLKLAKDQLGGYKTDAKNKLQVFINGKPYTDDPRTLKLTPHLEIVVTYGTDSELPKPILPTFDFGQGL